MVRRSPHPVLEHRMVETMTKRRGIRLVGGAQAEMVKRIGLVKIAQSTAKIFYESGETFVIAPNNVNDRHFFEGYHLAMEVPPNMHERLGFDSFLGRWMSGNEGRPAFFINEAQYMAYAT